MAEQVDETVDGRGMDRRSLIKKAAIGGAAVWVAPTLLSSAAHAQGSSSATISGFVDPFSTVTITGPVGSGLRVAPGFYAEVDADAEGAYQFDVIPGYQYCIDGYCSESYNNLGCVDTTAGGVYYLSCVLDE